MLCRFFSYDDEKIFELEVPSGVEVIGKRAIYDDNIRHIVLPEGLKEIGAHAFDCKALRSIVIPESVEKISEFAFCGCTSLKEVVLPEGIVEIPRRLFFGCKALKRIVLPNSVRIINLDAFDGCKALNELVMPERLKEMPAILVDYKSLKRIVIPDIEDGVCENTIPECDAIRTITIPLEAKGKHGKYVVSLSFLRDVMLNKELKPNDKRFANCEKIDSEFEHIVVKNGELISFISFKENITLPEGIVSIRENSVITFFAKKIILPSNLKQVDEQAFLINDNCLKTLCLPKTVSKNIISPLPCVEEYEVSPDSKKYKAVNGVVYSVDMKKLIKYPQKKKDKEFIIPSEVKEIFSEAFQYCFYLEKIVLPEGLEMIGSRAFEEIRISYIVIPKSVDKIVSDALSNSYRLSYKKYDKYDLKGIYEEIERRDCLQGKYNSEWHVPRAVFYKLSQARLII